jgi:hypothetical protein
MKSYTFPTAMKTIIKQHVKIKKLEQRIETLQYVISLYYKTYAEPTRKWRTK